MNKYQSQKLVYLLNTIKVNNAYWSEILAKYSKITLENIKDIYINIPVSTKKIITDNYLKCLNVHVLEKFLNHSALYESIFDVTNLSENHDKIIFDDDDNEYVIETTSGTMGKPFPIIKTIKEQSRDAIFLLKQRKQIHRSTTLENGFLLVHKTDDYLKKLNYRTDDRNVLYDSFGKLYTYMIQKQPIWMFSTTYLLGKFFEYINDFDGGKNLENVNLQYIETTSQKLIDDEKKQYTKMFKCPIVSNYGCREVWNIAYELIPDKMVVNQNTLIVDIVDEDGSLITNSDKYGYVVITSLTHDTLPLVKYYLGDKAKIIEDNGIQYITLEDGRPNDRIVPTSYSGTTIFRKVLRVLYFHYRITDIIEIRICQKGLKEFVVYLEKENKYDALFESLFKKIFNDQTESADIDYRFKFIYRYPWEKNNNIFKDNIYMCDINN